MARSFYPHGAGPRRSGNLTRRVFLLMKPSPQLVERFLAQQRSRTFSYRAVGHSRRGAPAGFTADHHRLRLGEGRATFARAVEALRSWRTFDLGWVSTYPPTAPQEPGTTVAVRVRHFGFWSLNACRVVYRIDDEGPVVRYGFAYGTLPDHGERGEERFTVEWHHEDNSVWYDLFAFSRPNLPLARLGYPLTRLLQKRFARDSRRAMALAAAVQWPGSPA
ncbi:MAG TPA: DUF1990 domain-containing protein [Thermoanaerobaculia bacterium]|nr:DUF1990 domain-containing protein [Thermoanaerobaculia bacterium]